MNIKFNPVKVGAYVGGAAIGAGLTWLGFHFMDKKGKNPEKIIQNKIEENNQGVRGNWSPEDFDKELGLVDNIEVLNQEDGGEPEGSEKEEKADDESEPPPASGIVVEKVKKVPLGEPYMLDESIFAGSENDGFKHCFMTYFQEDSIMVNMQHDHPEPQAWKAIGQEIWNLLEARALNPDDGPVCVRNPTLEIDYCIEIKNESFQKDYLRIED